MCVFDACSRDTRVDPWASLNSLSHRTQVNPEILGARRVPVDSATAEDRGGGRSQGPLGLPYDQSPPSAEDTGPFTPRQARGPDPPLRVWEARAAPLPPRLHGPRGPTGGQGVRSQRGRGGSRALGPAIPSEGRLRPLRVPRKAPARPRGPVRATGTPPSPRHATRPGCFRRSAAYRARAAGQPPRPSGPSEVYRREGSRRMGLSLIHI